MRSRAILLLVLMAASLVVASGIAWAATISCLNRSGNLCVGTNNRDTMTGRASADDMRARGGEGTLHARGANDKLTGGLGNDTLNGDLGSDNYLFDDGWGEDNIGSEGGGLDTLDFSALSENVHINVVPTAPEPEADSGFPSNTLNIADTNTLIEKVRGGAGYYQIRGNLANNTFFGNGGSDGLTGGGGNDALFGGAGGDVLYGHWGNDSLAGGDGSDSYRYFASDGAFGLDTIMDSLISDGNRYTSNEVTLVSITSDLTTNLVADPSQPEVKYTSAANPDSINWSDNVIDNVNNQSSGNDTVIGNSAANEIYSLGGNDTVSAGGGDDSIHVQDQSGGDFVYCGAGNDTAAVDSGDAISLDCES